MAIVPVHPGGHVAGVRGDHGVGGRELGKRRDDLAEVHAVGSVRLV